MTPQQIVLTEEQINKYILDPETCPFCGSQSLRYDESDYYKHNYYDKVVCKSCNTGWTEVFTLTRIENPYKEQ